MFLLERRQKRFYPKEICHLIRRVTEMRPFIKVFRFVGTNKSITTCIEKEVQSMNLSRGST